MCTGGYSLMLTNTVLQIKSCFGLVIAILSSLSPAEAFQLFGEVHDDSKFLLNFQIWNEATLQPDQDDEFPANMDDLLLIKDPIDPLLTNPRYWNSYHFREMSIDLLDPGLDEDLMSKQTMSVPGTVEDVIFRAPDSAALSRVDKHTAFLNATTAPLKVGRKRHRTSRNV
ncbi:hypothetical protein ASPSYDRAFT_52797 [Aspergillus sydowii CBS 593.65]|uniref:Uncharacterized protein n=1 Tax=Aspergillus sydowii CBS 593.65 TaxID=1036612 RepID=A0A1L9SXI3_9EURO|nr:uncharacterized protein ASPSYDRAFT_52797 [Aspergillus sydowii CBS 593.65]OJJ51915.1 hypothetical protein ASPSYDRAFT_52797 [Aspergillus sydowii CBS 593.65]